MKCGQRALTTIFMVSWIGLMANSVWYCVMLKWSIDHQNLCLSNVFDGKGGCVPLDKSEAKIILSSTPQVAIPPTKHTGYVAPATKRLEERDQTSSISEPRASVTKEPEKSVSTPPGDPASPSPVEKAPDDVHSASTSHTPSPKEPAIVAKEASEKEKTSVPTVVPDPLPTKSQVPDDKSTEPKVEAPTADPAPQSTPSPLPAESTPVASAPAPGVMDGDSDPDVHNKVEPLDPDKDQSPVVEKKEVEEAQDTIPPVKEDVPPAEEEDKDKVLPTGPEELYDELPSGLDEDEFV
ncbi:hypothetical protein BaOVIS_009690 [Babesia ovis]|uniref:Uncharacterized protein n=1 Tax=Babesia ovis TaxID=5869 RepID=A0A9W5WU38_BABOV|nr:hypothetical protein BaOVIS_009690 [Babesia ovis]